MSKCEKVRGCLLGGCVLGSRPLFCAFPECRVVVERVESDFVMQVRFA